MSELPTYCPGFYLWDVTITGTPVAIRVDADNHDHARHVARALIAEATGEPMRNIVAERAVCIGKNPVAVAWEDAHR